MAYRRESPSKKWTQPVKDEDSEEDDGFGSRSNSHIPGGKSDTSSLYSTTKNSRLSEGDTRRHDDDSGACNSSKATNSIGSWSDRDASEDKGRDVSFEIFPPEVKISSGCGLNLDYDKTHEIKSDNSSLDFNPPSSDVSEPVGMKTSNSRQIHADDDDDIFNFQHDVKYQYDFNTSGESEDETSYRNKYYDLGYRPLNKDKTSFKRVFLCTHSRDSDLTASFLRTSDADRGIYFSNLKDGTSQYCRHSTYPSGSDTVKIKSNSYRREKKDPPFGRGPEQLENVASSIDRLINGRESGEVKSRSEGRKQEPLTPEDTKKKRKKKKHAKDNVSVATDENCSPIVETRALNPGVYKQMRDSPISGSGTGTVANSHFDPRYGTFSHHLEQYGARSYSSRDIDNDSIPKPFRRRKKKLEKLESQKKAEDIENYKGDRPIDELISFIGGQNESSKKAKKNSSFLEDIPSKSQKSNKKNKDKKQKTPTVSDTVDETEVKGNQTAQLAVLEVQDGEDMGNSSGKTNMEIPVENGDIDGLYLNKDRFAKSLLKENDKVDLSKTTITMNSDSDLNIICGESVKNKEHLSTNNKRDIATGSVIEDKKKKSEKLCKGSKREMSGITICKSDETLKLDACLPNHMSVKQKIARNKQSKPTSPSVKMEDDSLSAALNLAGFSTEEITKKKTKKKEKSKSKDARKQTHHIGGASVPEYLETNQDIVDLVMDCLPVAVIVHKNKEVWTPTKKVCFQGHCNVGFLQARPEEVSISSRCGGLSLTDRRNQISNRPPKETCIYDGRLILLSDKDREEIRNTCISQNEIGKGGFGTVYKQTNSCFGITIATKKIIADSEEMKNSARREMYASRILHPFILPLLATFEERIGSISVIYFISPYCENRDLYRILNECRDNRNPHTVRLCQTQRMRIILQVARAIQYLHTPVPNVREIIIHKDISSANIVLDKNYNARLIDFGLAREIDDKTSRASGRLHYLHPDIGKPGCQASVRWDIYSFGVVILELLTGLDPSGKDGTHLKYMTDLPDINKHLASFWPADDEDSQTRPTLLLHVARKCLSRKQGMFSMKDDVIDKVQSVLRQSIMNLPQKEKKKCEYCMINPDCDGCGALLVAGNDTDDANNARAFKDDMEKFKRIITSRAPLVMGIRQENVKSVAMDNPGSSENGEKLLPRVINSIQELGKKSIHTLVVYFSCHGDINGENSFQLASKAEKLTMTEFQNMLSSLTTVRKVIIILDRCFADKITVKDKTIVQINASKSNESAPVQSVGSPFTKYLIQGLKAMSESETCDIVQCCYCKNYWATRNDYITVGSLLEYIGGHMMLENHPQPYCHFEGDVHSLKLAYYTEEEVFIDFTEVGELEQTVKQLPMAFCENMDELKTQLLTVFKSNRKNDYDVIIQSDTFRKDTKLVNCENIADVRMAWYLRKPLRVKFLETSSM